jgi:hypothetical protein
MERFGAIVAPNPSMPDEERLAAEIIERLAQDVDEAQDNLLAAKISQAEQANKLRRADHSLQVGDRVKLSTKNRRQHYKQKSKKDGCVAKFMPRFDGPYTILEKHAEFSTFTLDLPNQPEIFPVFHSSELEPFTENDDDKFPSRKLTEPDPIVVDGQQEYFVHEIIDERKRGRGVQYLVRYVGAGPEMDRWLSGRECANLEALDRWLARPKD